MKERMRKIFIFFYILVIAIPIASGQAPPSYSLTYDRINDHASLLTEEEKIVLNRKAYSIAVKYNFDLVIVSEKNIGNVKPKDYADNFFDNNGYGIGKNCDGCLFLQVTDSRDYWFSTTGRGIILFDSAIFDYDKLERNTIKYLREDNPFAAYQYFLSHWEEILALEAGF